MALSDKAMGLLKKIYAHRYQLHSWEGLVDEDPDEALEYMLQKIVNTLSDHHRDAAPLYVVMQEAVGGLRRERRERCEAAQKV